MPCRAVARRMGANWLYLSVELTPGADPDRVAEAITEDTRMEYRCEHGAALVFVGPGNQTDAEEALAAAGDAVDRAALGWFVDGTGHSSATYYERHDGELLTVDVANSTAFSEQWLLAAIGREYDIDVPV